MGALSASPDLGERSMENTLIVNITSYLPATTMSSNVNNTTDEGLMDYYDDLDPDVRAFVHWVFLLLSSVVLLVGLVGNCLVWFAVWRNPRMRSATNIFLVNLAVADFLVVLIVLPPTVAEDITGNWYLGREMCKLIKCLQRMAVFVSVMTLTAISMERWMAICRPLFFRPTSVVALRVIAAIWINSLVCTTPLAVSLDMLQVSETDYICQPSWSEAAESVHIWIVFTVFYVVPLGIMTFTYLRIALCLWRSGLPDSDDEASPNVPRAQLLLRRKKAKMLIMVVAMFALCYLPVYVNFILVYTGLMVPTASLEPLILTSHWLVYFSSAVNPIIYNFMSCNFRREFLIACHICCRRGSNHNTVYEAVRLRKFHKFQNRRQPRTFGKNVVSNDPSCTLQTQSSVMGTTASSCYSLCPQLEPATSTTSANLNIPGSSSGGENNISPKTSPRTSIAEPRNNMRNYVLQKNHFRHV